MSNLKYDYTTSDLLQADILNTIEEHTAFLAQQLNNYGYEISLTTKTNWAMTDFLYRTDFDRIRSNVGALQTAFCVLPDWQEIAYNNTVDFNQVNSLEWDLHTIYIWLDRMAASFRYSNTLISGEDNYR